MLVERPFLKKNFAQVVEDTLAELRSGRDNRVVLDDATEGSVLRTLVEAFGRELAVCYEQLERVYESGYLETATGASLDKVVELLGVVRLEAGWIEGEVVFSRATAAPFRIDIPAGTVVSGADVPVVETQADAVLELGAREARVPVRSIEPEGVTIEPERITVLNRPIAGIDTVTNPSVLAPRRDPESDDDLRVRARSAIRGGLTATASALRRSVLQLGIVEVEIVEDPGRPGVVDVVLAEPDLSPAVLEDIRRRVDEVRPAGVRVHVFEATAVWLRVEVRVRLEQAETPQARAALSAALDNLIREHVASLGVGESVRWNKIRNLIAGDTQVAEVELVEDVWPVHPVDALGQSFVAPADVEDAQLRLLGELSAPEGVFIGTEERARIPEAGLLLTLLDPEPPVWLDVEARFDPQLGEEASLQSMVVSALSDLFPSEALGAATTYTYEQLRSVLEAIDPAAGLLVDDLRFVVLFSSDGRAVTVDQDDPEASDHVEFGLGERIVIRSVRLTAVGGEGV
ncbi:MAG: baseplate J/gp47 family protein [Deltaproteobacteria bacterium]|nr:baseplate J/gp47 family protein [Deltaproteobacteria bacterium]